MSKERKKALIQDMAMRFVDDYKAKMRNVQRTPEDDIATAFYFGHLAAVKGFLNMIDLMIKSNREEAAKVESEAVKMVSGQITGILQMIADELEELNFVETNEENKNLN